VRWLGTIGHAHVEARHYAEGAKCKTTNYFTWDDISGRMVPKTLKGIDLTAGEILTADFGGEALDTVDGGLVVVAGDNGGGYAVDTTILAGGGEVVSRGGKDLSATISGGEQDVNGGSAQGVVVSNGGEQTVGGFGVVSGTVVSSGAALSVGDLGSADGARIATGGNKVVGGHDVGAIIGGFQFITGTGVAVGT
jgi:autotransporter passenger strand-loop-strand repeat protein